jgi:hypothetical protein
MPDEVIVRQAVNGEWRWLRRDKGNHETLSQSSETFTEKDYAIEQAKALNSDVEIVEVWD